MAGVGALAAIFNFQLSTKKKPYFINKAPLVALSV